MTRIDSLARRFVRFLSSDYCYYAILGLFIVEALWIALSATYPMAFDEDYHLGIIRLYAHHISPFWSGQPEGADAYGAIARDPSYLFQYLMSFPYRLISVFTSNQTIQVLILRLINMGLLLTALPIFKRVLLKSGASRALVHLCLALFVLVPIVPMLAAQINYDNLFIPLTGLVLLQVIVISQRMRESSTLPLRQLLVLGIVLMLTSIVKYAFLPIALAVSLYLLVVAFRNVQRTGLTGSLRKQLGAIQGVSRWLLIIMILLSSGLFIERYGVNLARYHKPVPDCGEVLTVEQCSAYGPWIRDHNLAAKNNTSRRGNPVTYTGSWFQGMWMRSFFAVDGPKTQFQTRGPLVLPGIATIIVAAIGVPLTLLYWRRITARWQASVLHLFAVVSLIYIGLLWLDEYEAFSRTGHTVAINGRYLLPVLLPILLLVGLAYHELLRKRPTAIKAGLALLVLISFIWGGGALTYILRSNDAWYWPSPAVRTVNHAVQHTLGPITPGYRKPIEFLH